MACDDPAEYERPISHWTQRELAEEAIKQNFFIAISSRHIGRLLAGLDLKPHKNKYWLHKKIDEYREQKIVDICGLYQEAIDLEKRNNNG